MYLILPEPEQGIAERQFRMKWVGREVGEARKETEDETVRNVSTAWNVDHLGERAIHLTEDEQAWFWKFVEEWLRHEAGQRLMRGTSSDPAIRRLVDLLAHQRAPTSVLNALLENAIHTPPSRRPIIEGWESPENEYLIVVAVAALGGGNHVEAENRLRSGLRSANGRESLAAWKALEWWIEQSGRDVGVSLVPPSVASVRDIGVSIGASQQSGLLGALRAACAVYRSGNPEFIEAVHSWVIQGLRRLQWELDYRASVADRQFAEELPLHRHWCVWLAWAIDAAGHGQDETVRSWIEAGDADPLFIVRLVREWNQVSNAAGDARKTLQ